MVKVYFIETQYQFKMNFINDLNKKKLYYILL